MNPRHILAFALIAAAQFGLFEAGLRTWGSSEAAPSFQGLFETDPAIGYRLKPHARTRFTTSEFTADIAINGAGLRDDDEVASKAPQERRIVLLGDSLVLSVQVPFRCNIRRTAGGASQQPALAVSLSRDQRWRSGVRTRRGAALLSLRRQCRTAGSGPAGRLRRQRRRGSRELTAQARRHPPNERGGGRLVPDAAASPRPAQHGPPDSPPSRRLCDRPPVANAGPARAAAAELCRAAGAAHRRRPRHRPRVNRGHRAHGICRRGARPPSS